jgi:hypothetical protein
MSSSILTLSSLAVSLLAASSLSLAASADPLSANAAETPEVVAAFRNQIFKHVDGSFKRLTVNCVPEKGQPAANCTLLYLEVGREEAVMPQTRDEIKASLQSEYADILSDPGKFCKETQEILTEKPEIEIEMLQDTPALVNAIRQIASACTKSVADGLRVFRKAYPRPEAMVGDMMKVKMAEARINSSTCYISILQHSRRFLVESNTQLRYEYRYKKPGENSLGMEIVLFKNTDSGQWNVLDQVIRADTAPASYKGPVDRYIPATSSDDHRRMDCRYIKRM